MAYTSLDVARRFLELAQHDTSAQRDISNMKLQKLVFFAQLLSVRVDMKRPLVSSDFHAWDYGPVSPTLYRKIKRFGANYLSLDNPEVAAVFADCTPISKETDDWANAVIETVWERLRDRSAVELSMLTHRRGSPWEVVYNRDRYGVIPLEEMARKEPERVR